MNCIIEYACISDIGKVREKNQDNFICHGQFMEPRNDNTAFPVAGTVDSRDSELFGVFDGLGGEECGEIAAYIAASDASKAETSENPAAALNSICKKSNADICSYALMNSVSSMGTTAAMIICGKKDITICNIGDSRIYRYSGNTLEQISTDHTVKSFSMKKPPLSQNLGIPPEELVISPYFSQGKYKKNDMYLICSDGLTDMLEDKAIEDIMSCSETVDAACRLIFTALSNGGKDNVTVIVLKIAQKHIIG